MAGAVSQGITGVGRFLRKEIVAAWPVFVFFLIGFLILILIVKLALAEFSIEIRVLSNAMVGALIAAKAALVLDETPLARSLRRYRRIIAVAVKTLLYGSASLLLGYVERFIEALGKVHGSYAAIQYVIEHVNFYRLLAWTMGISVVFALYFTFVEISQRLGDGELWAVFFEAPPDSHSSK